MNKNKWCLAAVFSVVLLLISVTAYAQDFIAPPESLPGGLSYQQWSGKWWQWAYGVLPSESPVFDTTGVYCTVNQSRKGPVWFLAGTNGVGPVTRSCSIPATRMIFVPLINWINDYPCPDPSFQPGPKQSLEQFLTIGFGPNWGVRQNVDHVTAVSASLDGVPVNDQDLQLPPESSKYRATSPIFKFNADPSWQAYDPCAGPGYRGVADGYWIMLKPLPVGLHTLSFSALAVFPTWSTAQNVTYDLTIY